MSDSSKLVAVYARRLFWLLAPFSALISLVVPATAWGDIYKWTDEKGRINISNIPPPASGKAKGVEIVLKEPRPISIPEHAATPTEQALLERIQSLERQLQARQDAPQAPAVPPPTPYPSNYPSTPPPPPPSLPNYYDGGYGAGYDNSYYPTYYASYYPTYSYPVVRSYSYAAYPTRAYITRPAFAAPRGGSFRGGAGHSGGRGGRR
jgi:hypothetical protein